MSDRDEREQALKRMAELWGPWYEVTFSNGLWHAKARTDGAEFHAATDQALHVAISRHYMDGLPLLSLIAPAD